MRASHNGSLKRTINSRRTDPVHGHTLTIIAQQGLEKNYRTSDDRSRARTCTPQLRRLVLDPVERRGQKESPTRRGSAGLRLPMVITPRTQSIGNLSLARETFRFS